MNEKQLSELLQNLPRAKASTGFTDRLLERLDEPRHRHPVRILAIAASICLLTVTFYGVRQWQQQTENQHALKQETLAQLERLQAEQQALERELEDLLLLKEEQPVLYLGGDDQVDVVLNVERFRSRRGFSIQPASLSSIPN